MSQNHTRPQPGHDTPSSSENTTTTATGIPPTLANAAAATAAGEITTIAAAASRLDKDTIRVFSELLQHPPQRPSIMPPEPPALPPLDLRPCLIPVGRLATLKIPRRRCLLDKWLCQGDLGYVFAPRGVGKTWLAMVLPLAISMGRSLGRWKAAEQPLPRPGDADFEVLPPEVARMKQAQAATQARKPVPVLYVDGEMPLELTQQRVNALDLAQGSITYLHHESIFEHCGSSLNLALPEHRALLTDIVVQQGIECLILDNLSSLTSGLDENAGIDFDPLSQWLLDFRRRKITVIVVHHAGRNGLMRGHSKREDACSWILELRDAKTDDDPGAKFTTHFAKPSRNTGETLPDLLWHFTTGEDGMMDIACEYAAATEYEQFIRHVKEGTQHQNELAEILGKPKSTINRWAVRALKEGHISGTLRKLLPPKGSDTPCKPRAYRDNDDGTDDTASEPPGDASKATVNTRPTPRPKPRPAKETSFFDDIVAENEAEAELAAANAEARALMQKSHEQQHQSALGL